MLVFGNRLISSQLFQTAFQVGTLALLTTRGPPLVTWRWALRDEGDDHDGRTGQYSGDQKHPAAGFLNYERRLMPIYGCAFLLLPCNQ